MTRNRWLLLGVVLAVVVCCLVGACGLAGFFWSSNWRAEPQAEVPQVLASPAALPTPVEREPTSPEQETARLVAEDRLPVRDLLELSRRLEGDAPLPAATPVPTQYRLGDQETFWVHNTFTSSFFTATAVLRYETEHAYWWVEEGYELNPKDLERSAVAFEEHTHPTNQRVFGSEWSPGIDNDPHVYIFLGDVPGVGGLFSGPDEYPATIRARSNEHEMFYISLDNALPGEEYFDGILAHEHQHMIHWAMDRDEETWVNEGLSELAAQLNGYDVGGSEVSYASLPDTQLTTWPDLEDSGPSYGASYLFLAYFYEQYGEEAIRRLVQEQANGIAGFQAVLAEVDPGRSFQELFADWVVANYLDESHPRQEQYAYADLNAPRPALSARHEVYPVNQRASVEHYAADYVALAGEGDRWIEFQGSTTVPLLGNQTHSGTYQWWAQRGDEGDATLTRAFDLAGLEKATLQAWMWYDLEVDYDYAYVQVSTDGQAWDLLENEDTTLENPSDSSYGPAFTGLSGGGDEARWTLQSFDLTRYAGQQIQVRFEVITDDSINRPGLAVDDIAIPELGYSDDVEAGDGGWQAAGWLRVTGQIPEQFLVQVVHLGDDIRVERLALDEQMQGRYRLAGGERAILIVSALAPSTTEPAVYSYRITPGQ